MLPKKKGTERKATHNLHLSQSLCQTPLSKLPRVKQALLWQVNVLHIRRIRCRGTADTRSNKDRIGLQDNTVIDNLVNRQGHQIVVLNDSALVRSTSGKKEKAGQ